MFYMRHDYVFGLDVPVGDLVLMQVLYGRGYLLNLDCHFGFWQLLVFLEVSEKRALVHVLQDQVK